MKTFIAAMAVVVMGTSVGFASETLDARSSSLAALARDARSAADHAGVAREYRQHAESMRQEAARLDQQIVAASSQAQPQMTGKWPAMYGAHNSSHVASLQREVFAAKQAVQDATVAADRHYRLAIEQGFAGRAN